MSSGSGDDPFHFDRASLNSSSVSGMLKDSLFPMSMSIFGFLTNLFSFFYFVCNFCWISSWRIDKRVRLLFRVRLRWMYVLM
jgi:hypothetical protein